MSKAKILFQLSGSIACFKACSLLSALVKDGYEIEVIATPSALKFVGEATLEGLTGRKAHTSTFEAGRYMDHIHLERWADLILLCPASANTLNKMAAGIGDDLVTTLFLAHEFTKPYLVTPAMNKAMYTHPATRASLERLTSWGIQVLETGSGALACGENGEGRMLEPDQIRSEIQRALIVAKLQATFAHSETETRNSPRRILITSGGTQEPIDGVRSITNTSTGRTGAQLAEWFAANGDAVTLLRAESAAKPGTKTAAGAEFVASSIEQKIFTSFATLEQSLRKTLAETSFDAVIHLAAVADYSVEDVTVAGTVHTAPLRDKLETANELNVRLTRNPKLVDQLKTFSKNNDIKVVAFKLTRTPDSAVRAKAVETLAAHANADLIVQNDLNEITATMHPFNIYRAHSLTDPVQAEGAESLAEKLSALLNNLTAAEQPSKKTSPNSKSPSQSRLSQRETETETVTLNAKTAPVSPRSP